MYNKEDFLLTIIMMTVNKDLVVEFIRENEKFFEHPEKICIAIYIDPWRDDIRAAVKKEKEKSKFTIIIPEKELPIVSKYGYFAGIMCYHYLVHHVVKNSKMYCMMSDKVRIERVDGYFDDIVEKSYQEYSTKFSDKIFSMVFTFQNPIVTREYCQKIYVDSGMDFAVNEIFGYLKNYFGVNRKFDLSGIKMKPYIFNTFNQNPRGALMTLVSVTYDSSFHRRFYFLMLCKRLFPHIVKGKNLYNAIKDELKKSFTLNIRGSMIMFFSVKKYPYFSRLLDSKILHYFPIYWLYRTFYNVLSVIYVITDKQVKYDLDGNHYFKDSYYVHNVYFGRYHKISKKYDIKQIQSLTYNLSN